MEPFTIRLKDRTVKGSALQPLRLKLDPGSRTTGMAVIDEVAADVPKGKYAGQWRGRVTCRASGSFDIRNGERQIICNTNHKNCKVIQRADGWQYEWIVKEDSA